MVVTCAPANWTASALQDFTALPFMCTVHAPQSPAPQPAGGGLGVAKRGGQLHQGLVAHPGHVAHLDREQPPPLAVGGGAAVAAHRRHHEGLGPQGAQA